MAMQGNIRSSELVDDAIRRLEEVGFNDDDHGDLAAICEEVLHEYGKLGHATIRSDSDVLAMTVSSKIVTECARKLDRARVAMKEMMDGPDSLQDRIQEDKAKQRRKGRVRRFLEDVADAYSKTEIEFTPGMSAREFE
jgi:hypothetical protein